MRKNRGSNPQQQKSYLSFFAPAQGAGFQVKAQANPTGAAPSRTALLNIVKKLDNSGA